MRRGFEVQGFTSSSGSCLGPSHGPRAYRIIRNCGPQRFRYFHQIFAPPSPPHCHLVHRDIRPSTLREKMIPLKHNEHRHKTDRALPRGVPLREWFVCKIYRKLTIAGENPTQPGEGSIIYVFAQSLFSLLFDVRLVLSAVVGRTHCH